MKGMFSKEMLSNNSNQLQHPSLFHEKHNNKMLAVTNTYTGMLFTQNITKTTLLNKAVKLMR